MEGGREGAAAEDVPGKQQKKGRWKAPGAGALLCAATYSSLNRRKRWLSPSGSSSFAAGHHVPRVYVVFGAVCACQKTACRPKPVHDVRPLEDPQEAQHRGHDGHRPDLPGERLHRPHAEAADGQGVQGPLRGIVNDAEIC